MGEGRPAEERILDIGGDGRGTDATEVEWLRST
jgi:hypothetical protein